MTHAQSQLRLGLLVALLFLACAVTLHCAPMPAHAQSEDASILLARVCVNESGFDSFADCDAIAAISIRNAGDRDLAPYLRGRFLRALAPVHARRNRPWIADLSRDGHEPRHWPSNVSWASIRPRWLALVAHVDGAVSGRIVVSCDADTWGGRVVDRERIARMLSRGGSIAQCGNTENVFLRWSRK